MNATQSGWMSLWVESGRWRRHISGYHAWVPCSSIIYQIAAAGRAFLEPHWRRWHADWGSPEPVLPSQWTCVRSSAFLSAILTDAGMPAHVESGVPDPNTADTDATGFWKGDMWCSHAWVRCGGFIADITSDQFGGPAIIVTASPDGRYRPGTNQKSTLILSPAGTAMLEPLLSECRLRARCWMDDP